MLKRILILVASCVVLCAGVSACSEAPAPQKPIIQVNNIEQPCGDVEKLYAGLQDFAKKTELEAVAKTTNKNFAKKHFAKKISAKAKHHHPHFAKAKHRTHHTAHAAPNTHAPVHLTGPPGCGT